MSRTGIRDSGPGRHEPRMLPQLAYAGMLWTSGLTTSTKHPPSNTIASHQIIASCFCCSFLQALPFDLAAKLYQELRLNHRRRRLPQLQAQRPNPPTAHRAPLTNHTTPRPPTSSSRGNNKHNNVRPLPSRPARIHPLARHRLAPRLPRAPAMVAGDLRQALEPSQPAPAAAPAAAAQLAAQRVHQRAAATTADV